jgi:hypothetical protein
MVEQDPKAAPDADRGDLLTSDENAAALLPTGAGVVISHQVKGSSTGGIHTRPEEELVARLKAVADLLTPEETAIITRRVGGSSPGKIHTHHENELHA